MAGRVNAVDDLGRRGIEFRSSTDALDTTSPAGLLLFNVVAAVAQVEREMTIERTKAALALAWQQNRPPGRPSRVSADQFRLIHRGLQQDDASLRGAILACGQHPQPTRR